jgi:hypothetical protein
VHQIKLARDRWRIDGQVVSAHLVARIGRFIEHSRVDVGRQHIPPRSDLLTEPTWHTGTAGAGLPTAPPLADAERPDMTEGAVVEQPSEHAKMTARHAGPFEAGWCHGPRVSGGFGHKCILPGQR